MDKPLAPLRCIMTAVVLLSVALYVASTLSCGAGAGPLTDYLDVIWKTERLNEDKGVLSQGQEGIQSIVDQLIEGRLSLLQAAATLCAEDESRPEHLRLPAYRHWRHLSKEERYMRQLLLLVEMHLQDDPRQDQVLKRLRKELENAS